MSGQACKTAKEETERVFEGFDIFEVRAPFPTELYVVGDGSLEELRRFADSMGIRGLFIEDLLISPDDLKIGQEHFRGLGLDILGGVQLDSHVFNRDVDSMDLSSPVETRIYVLHQGRAFGVLYTDPELDALRHITPESRVEAFAEERRSKARDRLRMSPMKDDPDMERFAEILSQDRQYRELNNDADRFYFVMKIARRPGNDALKKAVCKDDGGFSMEKVRRVLSMAEQKVNLTRPEPRQMVFDGE